MSVICQERHGSLVVQLDRPERKNAVTFAMYNALTEHLKRADSDDAVRSVVLTGSQGIFTSGNDLAELAHHPPTRSDSSLLRFLDALVEFSKPLIAAVDGYALGIGTSLLLHCDLVYATERARFQFPFTRLGLVPEAASSYLLPRLIGYPRAAELLLLSEAFDAHTALSFGMINGVTTPDNLMNVVDAKLQTFAALPAPAIQQTKKLLKAALLPHIRNQMQTETTLFVERLRSPDAAEAIQAFFEKRAPKFGKLPPP